MSTVRRDRTGRFISRRASVNVNGDSRELHWFHRPLEDDPTLREDLARLWQRTRSARPWLVLGLLALCLPFVGFLDGWWLPVAAVVIVGVMWRTAR